MKKHIIDEFAEVLAAFAGEGEDAGLGLPVMIEVPGTKEGRREGALEAEPKWRRNTSLHRGLP